MEHPFPLLPRIHISFNFRHFNREILSLPPNLIVAGSYSGHILLYDTRHRTPHPILKTPLTGTGHTHPVYSVNCVGTQGANMIISVSTDGVMCAWTTDMLARPQEYLELNISTPSYNPPPQHYDPSFFLKSSRRFKSPYRSRSP